MRYPIVIHKDDDSNYGVIVPDIPGCFSAGSSYEEAVENAHEAIECHLEGLLIDKEPIPMASDIDEHINQPDFADGIWAFIDIDLSHISGKVKRINITLPERILGLIDLYMKNHALNNRSSFITDATLCYIAKTEKQ